MNTFTICGQKIVEGTANGEALVSNEPISFIGGLDPLTGIVTEPGHQLEGQCVAGKILVYPTGKGFTGGSYRIYEMAYRKTSPAAIILADRESVVVLGCIMGNIPAVDHFEQDPCQVIHNGDYVYVDGTTGLVRVERK